MTTKSDDDVSRTSCSALGRREFLAGAAALVTTATRAGSGGAAQNVARVPRGGDRAHGPRRLWARAGQGLAGDPDVELVAVADADEKGLAAAVKRLGAPRGFPDYRRMLDEVKPDLVSICPRWLDQHRDMVVAAAERGVRASTWKSRCAVRWPRPTR